MREVRWGRLSVVVIALIAVWFLNYNSAMGRWDDQIHNCELGRDLVTTKNANGWRAHRNYIEKVLAARSVKGDVKAAADEAVVTFNDTVDNLDAYLAIPCHERYESPSILTGR